MLAVCLLVGMVPATAAGSIADTMVTLSPLYFMSLSTVDAADSGAEDITPYLVVATLAAINPTNDTPGYSWDYDVAGLSAYIGFVNSVDDFDEVSSFNNATSAAASPPPPPPPSTEGNNTVVGDLPANVDMILAAVADQLPSNTSPETRAAIDNLDRSNPDLSSLVMTSFNDCNLASAEHIRAPTAVEIAARIQSVTPPPPPPPPPSVSREQTCGCCRRPGHNVRTCSYALADRWFTNSLPANGLVTGHEFDGEILTVFYFGDRVVRYTMADMGFPGIPNTEQDTSTAPPAPTTTPSTSTPAPTDQSSSAALARRFDSYGYPVIPVVHPDVTVNWPTTATGIWRWLASGLAAQQRGARPRANRQPSLRRPVQSCDFTAHLCTGIIT